MGRALTAREASRVRELCEEIETLRDATRNGVQPVIADIEDLTGLERVLVYQVAQDLEGCTIALWAMGRELHALRALLVKALTLSSTKPVLFYDLVRPPPSQRNRLVEATSWIDRSGPGTWKRSRMHEEVMGPAGLGDHKQPRILLCDGDVLLAWFGAIHPEPVTTRQATLLRLLAPSVRRSLWVERQLERSRDVDLALDAVLERIGVPTYVISSTGRLAHCNAVGRAALATHRDTLVSALRASARGRPPPAGVEITRLDDGYLVMLRAADTEARIASCVELCAERWTLTPRQREVLALVARGLANSTIAATLSCGERAVELHVTAILDRAGVDNRASLVARVLTSL